MKDCKYKIEEDAKETIGEIIDRRNRRRKPKGENMKKIIIEQCIAIDATAKVFEMLADAIVLEADGYSSPKTYKFSKKPLEFIIKEHLVEDAKKEEEPIPDEDGAL